jgi:integrase
MLSLIDALSGFEADWRLRGRAHRTVSEYSRYLKQLLQAIHEPDLDDVLNWLESIPSVACRRQSARAVRSFGKYLSASGDQRFKWWPRVPLQTEPVLPQRTVSEPEYRSVRGECRHVRDSALVEVLWCAGLRRSEIAHLRIEDVNLTDGYVTVARSKTGRPRRAPLSVGAISALADLIGHRQEGFVFELTSEGIGAVLKRRGWPPAHAWRRGWAVHALRSGVSEASVRTAGGWKTGAMVVRYTAALAEDLAIEEFRLRRLPPKVAI